MLFIALAKVKAPLTKEVIVQNLKDIEADTRGRYDTWASTGRSGGTIP